MKMKSVVLAAATAVASSAFAQIFDTGDIYTEWFNSTGDVEFDTELASPNVITNEASLADGYAVTAAVTIVVHAELPAVPSPFDNLSPKGAICAAVTNSPSISTNWYGLAGGAWLALEGVGTPTEANHTLVMEFKDKGGAQKVRYSIDGTYATNGVSGWLDSGSTNTPKYVAFAGTGRRSNVHGLLVTEKVAPSASAVSWTEGYDFTNGTVSVTLVDYNSGSMGNVSLIVKNSAGTEVGSATFGSVTQSVTPTLTPGETYTYSIVQNAGGVVTTNDVGTFVAAAPGAGFSASVEDDAPVVVNGEWAGDPDVDESAYAISGSEVFNIGEGALEAGKLVIVDNKVTFTTWGDANDLQDFDDGTFAAITAVTNDSDAVVWKAYKGPENGWLDLVGGVTPVALNTPYDIRATFDFSGTNPKMAFSMKASGASAFIPFTCGDSDSAWITSTVATNVLSEVGYSGVGKLASVVGGNSDTNIAAVGAKSYATLADAIAAATNGSNTVTLRTNTQWPSTTPVGKYTVLTNGFSLVGLPSGEGGITITPSGVGFVIVVEGGSSHISGAGNIQIDSSAMTKLGINSEMTPAEIAAELTAKEKNGIEKWANYVLGITGTDATKKPFAAPVQNANANKLTFSLGGVNVNEGTGATVGYSVEELSSPTDTSGTTHTTNEFGNVEIDVPAGVKYYRVKVTITLPD